MSFAFLLLILIRITLIPRRLLQFSNLGVSSWSSCVLGLHSTAPEPNGESWRRCDDRMRSAGERSPHLSIQTRKRASLLKQASIMRRRLSIFFYLLVDRIVARHGDLTITDVKLEDEGWYLCIVSADGGVVKSASSYLSVARTYIEKK